MYSHYVGDNFFVLAFWSVFGVDVWQMFMYLSLVFRGRMVPAAHMFTCIHILWTAQFRPLRAEIAVYFRDHEAQEDATSRHEG